jgi:hypothetical protein
MEPASGLPDPDEANLRGSWDCEKAEAFLNLARLLVAEFVLAFILFYCIVFDFI